MTLTEWLRRTRSGRWIKGRSHGAHDAADHPKALGGHIQQVADASRIDGAPTPAPADPGWPSGSALTADLGTAAEVRPPSTDSADRSTVLEAMNHAVDAIYCVDGGGHISWMNQRAVSLARQRDGLVVRVGRLTAIHRCDRLVLAQLLAAASGRRGESMATNTMPIRRPSGRRSLRLSVQPLMKKDTIPPAVGADRRMATAIVIVVCPDDSAVPTPAELAAVHGFTLAEARLAAALASGAALTDYANAVGVTRETVRSQLKSIMLKAEVHRQADLVRVILEMPTARWRCTL